MVFFQYFSEGNVGGVSWFSGDNFTFDVFAHECQITDDVEQFMAGGFVAETKGCCG